MSAGGRVKAGFVSNAGKAYNTKTDLAELRKLALALINEEDVIPGSSFLDRDGVLPGVDLGWSLQWIF